MAIEITEEMVQAARRKMPARWSMQDLSDAIAAAIEAAPPIELTFNDVDISDEQRAAFADALAEAANRPLVRVFPASVELRGGSDGAGLLPPVGHCVPSELRTGGPIYSGPLAGITEIAAHLSVGRSTVVGWTKRADKIGMPAPLAELAAGPVYSLDAVEVWYRAWKSDTPAGDADAAA